MNDMNIPVVLLAERELEDASFADAADVPAAWPLHHSLTLRPSWLGDHLQLWRTAQDRGWRQHSCAASFLWCRDEDRVGPGRLPGTLVDPPARACR